MATEQKENAAIVTLQRKLAGERTGLRQEREHYERVKAEWDEARPQLEAEISQLEQAIVALGGTPATDNTDTTTEED